MSEAWRGVKTWLCTWSLSCLMFFSMCGRRPLEVNSWMNCLMWSWSFRVRHAPWLPAPPAMLSGSLAPFLTAVVSALRVCRLPGLLTVSSWRGWMSRLLETPSGRKQHHNMTFSLHLLYQCWICHSNRRTHSSWIRQLDTKHYRTL